MKTNNERKALVKDYSKGVESSAQTNFKAIEDSDDENVVIDNQAPTDISRSNQRKA